jgi:hypothetical protein
MARQTLLAIAVGLAVGALCARGEAQAPASPTTRVDAKATVADFSGTWTISSKVGENPVAIRCTLAQSGTALTGTCKPSQFDPSPTARSPARCTWVPHRHRSRPRDNNRLRVARRLRYVQYR